jgi:formylmethanofuran dehydrogenase subunit E
MIMPRTVLVAIFCLLLTAFGAVPATAGDCAQCHGSFRDAVMRPQVPPIRIGDQGQTDTITLGGLFQAHGHPCCGTSISFRAIQLGLERLYGDQLPARDDLVILTQAPLPGFLDTIYRVMRGPKPGKASKPLAGMKPSWANFTFTLLRKSTGTMVTVKAKTASLPKDFFALKARLKNNKLNKKEKRVLHDYVKDTILIFLKEPADKLYDCSPVRKVMAWGLAD